MWNTKPFIIFADARTGGTHVMSKLNSHKDIHAVSEPFAHHDLKTHDEQLKWMNEFFTSRGKQFNAVGFRTKIEHQADHEAFIDFVNDNDIVCFSLQRRNLVKKAISRITAVQLYKETKDYNRKSSEFNKKSVKIPVRKLMREIEICEEQKRVTNEFLLDLFDATVIFYEQILINETAFFNRIIDKLKLPRQELVTSVFKNTSDDLSKSLENYEEISNHLKSTMYIDDLEEILILPE